MRCGTLRDVTPEGNDSLTLPPDQHYGFQVVGVDIMFRGFCPACAET
jgi:Fur family ferric uptake transcriptional regulator